MATTNKKLPEQQQTATTQPVQSTALKPDVVTPNYSGYHVGSEPSTGSQSANAQQGTNTQQNQQNTPQSTTGAQQANQNSDVGSLLNMPGVSDTTKQTLGSLVANGYKPSANVTAAMSELQQIIAQQPAAFQSQHMGELNNILSQIMGRKSFSYDMSNDPFYQNYRQMYMNAGKQAMGDTVGQVSALTGGYGNSWAATAGQQQYNQYLQQLNDRVPELQQMALDRYNAEGDLLMQQYDLMGDAYNREYGEWQDAYNRWLNERDNAQANYESERNFDYGQHTDNVNNWYTIAGMEGDQYNADRDYEFQQEQFAYEQEQDAQAQAERDRDYYYDWAMTQIENGQMPSADTLLKAGLTEEEVQALLSGLYGSGGSGSGGSGGSSGGSGSGNYAAKNQAASSGGSKVSSAIANASSNAGLANLLRGASNAEQAEPSINAEKDIDINKYRRYFKTN